MIQVKIFRKTISVSRLGFFKKDLNIISGWSYNCPVGISHHFTWSKPESMACWTRLRSPAKATFSARNLSPPNRRLVLCLQWNGNAHNNSNSLLRSRRHAFRSWVAKIRIINFKNPLKSFYPCLTPSYHQSNPLESSLLEEKGIELAVNDGSSSSFTLR